MRQGLASNALTGFPALQKGLDFGTLTVILPPPVLHWPEDDGP